MQARANTDCNEIQLVFFCERNIVIMISKFLNMDNPIPLISPSLTLADNAFLQRWRQRIVRLNLRQHCLLSVLGHEKRRSFSLSKDLRNTVYKLAITYDLSLDRDLL